MKRIIIFLTIFLFSVLISLAREISRLEADSIINVLNKKEINHNLKGIPPMTKYQVRAGLVLGRIPSLYS